ncbi:hypothetical protein WJX73_008568 [Symbiochloris irregularis]|uniref:Uncharacterized protein n=1 Tax=Symbiochloris irregularis TaxID=706552 RepID=A0AAW1P6X5_9CHLO
MPYLLRLAYLRGLVHGGDSEQALSHSARGVALWKAALERGLAPDDETLKQLTQEQDSPFEGMTAESLRWPDDPLRSILIRMISQLGIAYFAKKYPAVLTALLRGVLELTCKYQRDITE